MNTVLIVDDEVIAVRALKNGVDWVSFGVDKVLTAYSMQQAQVIFMDTEIDLMLCDIEMPDASGLELFEWVKSYFPYVACIYVTCHPDFNYLKQALQLGSFDYILKPIDYDELDAVLKRVFVQIEEQKMVKEHTHKRARKMLREHVDIPENGDDMIRMICIFIREHLADEITMIDLANVVHLNAQYMVRMFKKKEGISILEYISRERIRTAKKLLRETEYAISFIAGTVGYPNYSYFTKVFKKFENMTPQEYRKGGAMHE